MTRTNKGFCGHCKHLFSDEELKAGTRKKLAEPPYGAYIELDCPNCGWFAVVPISTPAKPAKGK